MSTAVRLALLLSAAAPLAAQIAGPAVSVDLAAGKHTISPYIYGMAAYNLPAALQKTLALPLVRSGGDGTTRYNWQLDSSNAGFDWFFMGGGNASPTNPTPSGSIDALVNADRATRTQTLLTVPIIPYINGLAQWNCSFPVSVYGAQQAVNPYVHPNGDDCGNSLRPDGTQLLDSNIAANNVANSANYQAGWVQHLVGAFGHGGVKFYQLDNEPYGWGNTHRDVVPGGAPYTEIAALGVQYATAIKGADATALILGPSDFTLGGWVGDTSKQNGLFAGQYYLQQMYQASRAQKIRLLNYFDEHYYFDTSTPDAQLAATRTLWDPTYNGGTWVEQYVFQGNMQLIPRFKSWIAKYYPGTGLAFSEYSIDSGRKQVEDALAEADVLGIFGREGVGVAAMWSPPAATDPIAFSFRMFRNYDGAGSQFGYAGVSAVSADQTTVSAYASTGLRGRTPVLTLLLINKGTADLTVPVTLANPAPATTASAWAYTGANLTAIVPAAPVAFSGGAAAVTLPARSMLLLAVPLS